MYIECVIPYTRTKKITAAIRIDISKNENRTLISKSNGFDEWNFRFSEDHNGSRTYDVGPVLDQILIN